MHNSSDQNSINNLIALGYKIIKPFAKVTSYNAGTDQKLFTLAVLDVETNGLDYRTNHIIELAIVVFHFDAAGNIYDQVAEYSSFNDLPPGVELSQEIQELTGITPAMIKGHKIDITVVNKIISQCDLCVAHNAKFDRPFVEKLSPVFIDKPWGCSIKDIDFRAEGIGSSKLDYLAYKIASTHTEGFHRAEADVRILIDILSHSAPKTKVPLLKILLDNVKKHQLRIFAMAAPFEAKDSLKARGYTWSPGENGTHKAWYTEIAEENIDAEIDWLSAIIYKGDITLEKLRPVKLTAKNRYRTEN